MSIAPIHPEALRQRKLGYLTSGVNKVVYFLRTDVPGYENSALAKIAKYAVGFFLSLLLTASIVGIPLLMLAVKEITLQRANERRLSLLDSTFAKNAQWNLSQTAQNDLIKNLANGRHSKDFIDADGKLKLGALVLEAENLSKASHDLVVLDHATWENLQQANAIALEKENELNQLKATSKNIIPGSESTKAIVKTTPSSPVEDASKTSAALPLSEEHFEEAEKTITELEVENEGLNEQLARTLADFTQTGETLDALVQLCIQQGIKGLDTLPHVALIQDSIEKQTKFAKERTDSIRKTLNEARSVVASIDAASSPIVEDSGKEEKLD